MSAGPNAKPLGLDGWFDLDGNKITTEQAEAKAWAFLCECGYSGFMQELLAEDDNDTLYCPNCRNAGWVWD